MDNVLTLIANPQLGGLDDHSLEIATNALTEAGASPGAPVWLATGIAADIPFSTTSESQAQILTQAQTLVAEALAPAPLDVAAQAIAGRRKRLLVADMESTIIENEMLDELAHEIGASAEIAAITARAMNGELDFEESLRGRVALFAGLEAAALDRGLAKIRITPGAEPLVRTMRANGAYCALVSGGFTFYTNIIRERIGFDIDQANIIEIENDIITGAVASPVLGRDAKREALMRFCDELNITVAETMTVGDGANDLAMLTAAGAGVAFHAKPFVAKQARFNINHGDLTALLYMQGYRQDEFAN
ncbi:MAG: phosphoserine phosphatase SerB [Alphaproteobacteria bacterium]|nr:phosphoserine phosphatase SerB [Alphaproteobacteria bacterium]